MCNLVLFVCRECRSRFPAFHPEHAPEFDLQITKQCSNDVAEWAGGAAPAASTRQAPTCTGLCGACARELEKAEKEELL